MIDKYGLSAVLTMAFEQVLRNTKRYQTPEIIIDGNVNYAPEEYECRALIGADASVPAVSAASIVAKVARDKYMVRQARHLAGYGFEAHKGYGTSAHREALSKLGVSPLHRKTFKPVMEFIV